MPVCLPGLALLPVWTSDHVANINFRPDPNCIHVHLPSVFFSCAGSGYSRGVSKKLLAAFLNELLDMKRCRGWA